MVALNFPPAFGFESQSINAGKYYQKLFTKKRTQPLFLPQDAYFTANAIKILAYFPFLGSLIGLARIVAAIVFSGQAVPNKLNHFLRGIAEMLSLGLLLLIVDIVVTIRRRGRAQRMRQKNSDIVDIDEA